MPKPLNLTGVRFGRLVAVSSFIKGPTDKNPSSLHAWVCLCDCGTTTEVVVGNLRSGSIKSCGCLRAEVLDKTTHGLSNTQRYSVWYKMMQRCKDKSYRDYGSRGISVCERWHTFENFYADMGPCPSGKSLDRIDNDKGYSPENCRWASAVEQANNKRDNRRVTFEGKTQTVAQWARDLKVSPYTLYSRLNKSPPEIAFAKMSRWEREVAAKAFATTVIQL